MFLGSARPLSTEGMGTVTLLPICTLENNATSFDHSLCLLEMGETGTVSASSLDCLTGFGWDAADRRSPSVCNLAMKYWGRLDDVNPTFASAPNRAVKGERLIPV